LRTKDGEAPKLDPVPLRSVEFLQGFIVEEIEEKKVHGIDTTGQHREC
jgi:hypothetical protein